MVTYVEARNPRRAARIKNTALFAFKLAVTGTCFWYVWRQVDVADISRIARTFDFPWAVFATLLIAAEIPLVALRWREIVDALGREGERTPAGPMIAITSIGIFFGQVLPNLAGDAVRVWLLARLGRNWRQGVPSVLIDRGVGVLVLLTIGFITLLFPSALTALGGYRVLVIEIFAVVLVAVFIGLFLVPRVAPLLERFKLTRLLGRLARATHHVLIEARVGIWIFAIAFAIHLLTILSVWSLGRAQGLALPIVDAALLFTLMVGISLIPITIGGWGLRELAVSALLQSHGISLEQALFFSVCFGLVLTIAALPGAVAWAVFSPARYVDAARVGHE